MKNLADGLLADFGIDIEKVEEKPKYYKFTSKITNETKDIPILPGDIIKDGELRRIIRDETGAIPEWAKPKNFRRDYVRITPDGKVYGKLGKQLKILNSGKYSIPISHNKKKSSISIVVCMNTSFNIEDLIDGEGAYNSCNPIDGIDVTTLRTKYSESHIRNMNRREIKQRDIDGELYEYKRKLYRIEYRCKHVKTYSGISINDDMFDYEAGAKWYANGISYRLKSNSQLDIEKDIVKREEYSLKWCLIVPKYINNYFTRLNNPNIGIRKTRNKFEVTTQDFLIHKRVHIGIFKTFEEAHQAWADFKNKQLQEVVIPYFIEDVFEEDREHPMVLKVLEALRNFKFR